MKGKFTAEGFLDSSFVKSVQRKVHVRLPDGTEHVVEPHQLREVNSKKIHQFDLSNVRPPELPSSKRRRKFSIPPGEFGSDGPTTQPVATFDANASSRSPGRTMEPHRAADRDDLRLDRQGQLLQHPALTAYAKALTSKETTWMPATMPPRTTSAPGQTPAATTAYPREPLRCAHPVDMGRRTGNAHGKFMECILCGKVWKALTPDYRVPITNEMVPVYKLEHGRRRVPGGAIDKKTGVTTEAERDSLVSCYSCSARSSGPTPSTSSTAAAKSASTRTSQDKTFDGAYGNHGIVRETGYDNAHSGDRRHRPGVRASADGGNGAHVGGGLVNPSKGALRRMQTSARQALASSKLIRGVTGTHVSEKRWPRRSFKYDIIEVFAGSGMVTFAAPDTTACELYSLSTLSLAVTCPMRSKGDGCWTRWMRRILGWP